MQSLSISSFDLCSKDGEKCASFCCTYIHVQHLSTEKKYPAICKKILSSSFSKDIRFYAFYYVIWQKIPSKSLQSNIDGWAGNLFWTPKRSKDRSSFVGPAFHTKYIILDSYIQISYIKRAFGDFYCSPFPFLLPNLWGELGNEIGTYL